MIATIALLGIASLALVILLRPTQRRLPAGTQLLDGPPAKPVIGNLLDIPPFHSWLKFREWSQEYGPLFRLNIAGRNHIIVSTEEIANDLLRERGTIYSSREQLPMAAQILSNNLRVLFLPYGDIWRDLRKLMHNLANVKVAVTFEPIQEEESLRAVRDLVREPDKYEIWFERYAAGLILRLAYSKRVYTGRESFIRRILQVVRNLERVASLGAYLVDTLPFLMYLPSFLAPFKREGARLHAEEIDLFRTLLDEGINADDASTEPPNFCQKWHENQDLYNISRDHAAYTIGTMFEAGAGTTAAAMMSFTLAMTIHLEEFKKLQQDVDAVVGPDRVPTFKDIPNLPRVRAVAKETLRWRPVTAGGLPHMLTKDDVYQLPDGRSVFLAAGANIHPVQWSIHREPNRYPDPDYFRPERWLEKGWPTYKEPLTVYPSLQNFSSFGFGRRICPGQDIASRSLFILIARIAWSCNITQKLDTSGKPIVPHSYKYNKGFNIQPLPFDFDLKPREGRAEILEAQYQSIWGKHVA